MKARYWLLLSVPLALAACQGSEAPAPQSTASDMQTAPTASNAVEVKKPAVSDTAKAMQESLKQANKQSAETVAELTRDVANASANKQASEPAIKSTIESAIKSPRAAAEKKVAAAPAAPKKPAVVAPVAKAAPAMPEKKPAVVAPKPTAAPAAPTFAMGDAAKGAKLVRKCKACHNFDARKKVGPGLAGIFVRKAGVMPDMKYSASLAAGGWSWDAEHLAAWVCDSKKAIKTFSGNAGAKTKMGRQRICDPGKQADLIAYLKTL